MFDDEPSTPLPNRKGITLATPPLHESGVSELQDYVAALRAEIGRAEAQIAARQAHRAAAEDFFRAPGPASD